MRHLARDRGLEDAFLGELALLDQRVQQALEGGSREKVEAALGAVRAFSLQLASTKVGVWRFAEHGRVPAQERPSTLVATQEKRIPEQASVAERRPSEEILVARDSLLL